MLRVDLTRVTELEQHVNVLESYSSELTMRHLRAQEHLVHEYDSHDATRKRLRALITVKGPTTPPHIRAAASARGETAQPTAPLAADDTLRLDMLASVDYDIDFSGPAPEASRTGSPEAPEVARRQTVRGCLTLPPLHTLAFDTEEPAPRDSDPLDPVHVDDLPMSPLVLSPLNDRPSLPPDSPRHQVNNDAAPVPNGKAADIKKRRTVHTGAERCTNCVRQRTVAALAYGQSRPSRLHGVRRQRLWRRRHRTHQPWPMSAARHRGHASDRALE